MSIKCIAQKETTLRERGRNHAALSEAKKKGQSEGGIEQRKDGATKQRK
jgi:hypothetical protein